jgi:hypothetical protein
VAGFVTLVARPVPQAKVWELLSRWWPLAVVALGLAGLSNLRPARIRRLWLLLGGCVAGLVVLIGNPVPPPLDALTAPILAGGLGMTVLAMLGTDPRLHRPWVRITVTTGATSLTIIGVVMTLHRLAPDSAVYRRLVWAAVAAAIAFVVVILYRRVCLVRGPMLLVAAGLVLLLVTCKPPPEATHRPLPSLVLLLTGLGLLVHRALDGRAVERRHLDRLLLIGRSRRLQWLIGDPAMLSVAAFASGSVLTLSPPTGGRVRVRMEVTAILAHVVVEIPDDWTFHETRYGPPRSVTSTPPAEADLQIVVLPILADVEVVHRPTAAVTTTRGRLRLPIGPFRRRRWLGRSRSRAGSTAD